LVVILVLVLVVLIIVPVFIIVAFAIAIAIAILVILVILGILDVVDASDLMGLRTSQNDVFGLTGTEVSIVVFLFRVCVVIEDRGLKDIIATFRVFLLFSKLLGSR